MDPSPQAIANRPSCRSLSSSWKYNQFYNTSWISL